QEHLTGRRVREPGREQRETALVAADDAELLTGQPGQPLPRDSAGLQQVNKPVPACAHGDCLANTPDEIGRGLAGAASHASTLPPGSATGPPRRRWRANAEVIPDVTALSRGCKERSSSWPGKGQSRSRGSRACMRRPERSM